MRLLRCSGMALAAAISCVLTVAPAASAGKQDYGAPSAMGAAPPTAMRQIQAVALTPGLVDRFIAGVDAMMNLARKYGLNRVTSGDSNDPMGGFMDAFRGQGARAEMTRELNRLGFASEQQWRNVATNTMAAYAYARSGINPSAMQGQMQMAMQQVLNNPSIPESHKQRIRDQLARMNTQQTANAPSEANLAVVRTKMQALDALVARMQQMSTN